MSQHHAATLPSVLVVSGGISHEREVSSNTGAAIFESLKEKGHQVDLFDLSSLEKLSELENRLQQTTPTAVFNALHGTFGEDGQFAAWLNDHQQPYTHSGQKASALAFHKPSFKTFLQRQSSDFPLAPSFCFKKDAAPSSLPESFDFPLVAKPTADGSSVDIHLLYNATDWDTFLSSVQKSDTKEWMVEKYVDGLELTICVLKGKALTITEARAPKKVFDYDAKYKTKIEHLTPAPLPLELSQKLMTLAEKAHKLSGCRTLSRTDFRYDPKTGETALLETNTHPGMTTTSFVPEQAQFCGYSFYDIVSLLLSEARFGD